MGSNTSVEYTGMDKYPGWIATGITLVITAIFLGAVFASAGSHSGDHGGDHGGDHAKPSEPVKH